MRLTVALLLAAMAHLRAATQAYWEFDRMDGRNTPAAVGGEAFGLRQADADSEFAVVAPPSQRLPNPDRTPGFVGDASANGAALACPSDPDRNHYLTTGPGTNLLRLHRTSWTLEGWIRHTGHAPEGYGQILVATRDNPNFCGFNLMLLRPASQGEPLRLACHFEVKATDAVPHSSFMVSTSPAIAANVWHHFALTWDATKPEAPRAEIFVNGIRAAHGEAPADFDTESADQRALDCLHIGAREAARKNGFAGEIDEFRISDAVLRPTQFLMFPAEPRPLLPACRVAKARQRAPQSPASSDVLMRALRWRPRSAKDSESVMRAMDDFHVTGLVWAYIHDPEHIAEVTRSGRVFQGAVTSSLQTMRSLLGESTANDAPDVPAFIEQYATRNLDGTPNEQPWKRYWSNDLSRVSGCCSNPEFEELYVRAVLTYIRAGATMIQRDEGGGNTSRPSYGGCFCPWCMKGFRSYLKERVPAEKLATWSIEDIDHFDYAAYLRAAEAPSGDAFRNWQGGELKAQFLAFQADTSRAFFQRTRQAISEQAGFPVAMSCNNGVHVFDEVMQQFDWFFGELSYQHANPSDLYHLLKRAEYVQRLQVVTMPKKGGHVVYPDPDAWERQTRQTIAMSYASGGICMAPWDVYMPDTFDDKRQRSMTPRYFGEPSQYADLFGFIRASARYLDDYEDAAAIGPGLLETRWGLTPPLAIDGSPECYAIVRAKPDEPNAPVAIHLVDWRPTPKPTTLALLNDAFFPGSPLAVSLLAPPPFDATSHQQAEKTKDYQPLVRRSALPVTHGKGIATVRVPPLTPWGILLVEPVASSR